MLVVAHSGRIECNHIYKNKLPIPCLYTPYSKRKYTLCFPVSTQNVAGAIPHTLSWVLHDVGFEYLPTETQSVYFLLELSVSLASRKVVMLTHSD